MTSVFLALPYNKPDCRHFTISLVKLCGGAELELQIQPGPYGMDIASARNYLIECFKLNPCDFILYIDNDAAWAFGSVERLVGHNVPMICGGFFTKDIPPRPTIGRYMGQDKEGKDHYSFNEYAKAAVEYAYRQGAKTLADNAHLFDKPELMEIDGCGFHFTLVRRDVIEALHPPYFVMAGKSGAGEDFYFCKRVRDAGFPIYTDLSVQTAHWAGEDHDFGLRELLNLNMIANRGEVLERGETLKVG